MILAMDQDTFMQKLKTMKLFVMDMTKIRITQIIILNLKV